MSNFVFFVLFCGYPRRPWALPSLRSWRALRDSSHQAQNIGRRPIDPNGRFN